MDDYKTPIEEIDEEMDVDILLWKRLSGIQLIKQEYGDEIIFECEDGKKYRLFHKNDCCERVTIEDVIGNFNDLIGLPLLMAEKIENKDEDPPEVAGREYEYERESFTWTFYKFATIEGYVTIRWYGESNGYYSESVDFEEIRNLKRDRFETV